MRTFVKFVPIISLVIIALATQSLAQADPAPELLFHTEDELCSESIKAHIDGLYMKLNEDTSSIGVIVSSADRNIPGRYRHYVEAVKKAITFRHYPIERVRFVRRVDTEKMIFDYWVVPWGMERLFKEDLFTEQITSPTLFDMSMINTVGKSEVFFGGEDEPCDLGLNFHDFAKHLKSDPQLRGVLVSFAGRPRNGEAKRALAVTRKVLLERFDVPASKLSAIYDGVRTGEPEMQIWLVPRGSTFSIEEARSRTRTE